MDDAAIAGDDAGRKGNTAEELVLAVALAFSLVLDPFGGSGSTLIACHGTGRKARLIELDPKYVDVICRRYQEHTGDKPVLEATGEPHDFTEG